MTTTATPSPPTAGARPLKGFAMVPVGDLHPSPNNPRARLTDIDDLAQSIYELGMIQPIIAQRRPGADGLQVIAGHRRLEAAKRIRMTEVPVIVRRDLLPDDELLAMIVENGQRTDLDPIEEARAFAKLRATGNTMQDIARKIGRSQMHVSNRLTLLSLTVEEQEQLRAGETTIAAATSKARVDSGTARPTAKGKKSAQYLDLNHDLGTRARARCQRLSHKSKGAASVGGVACGECWESVIRADERQHLHQVSAAQGKCVLCDATFPASTDIAGNPTC